MPAPAIAAAATILTAVGRFAAPYLAKELGKVGTNKFIQTYGNEAFTSLNQTLAAETPMVNQDNIPMVNSDFASDTVSKSVTTTGSGLVIGGESKEILPPPEPFTTPEDRPTDTTLSTPIPTSIDTTVSTPIPDKQDTTVSTPIPKPEGPIVYYNKDAEIQEGLEEYERVYNEEKFSEANKQYPKLDPANSKKIVEADKHFGAKSLARKYGNDMDNTQLIYISPEEYLNLATEMDPDNEWSKAKIKYLEDKINQGKEIGEIPVLYVGKKGEDYTVRGHEGRHRAQAFLNAGYDKIPVRIEGYGKDKENNVENKLYTATKRSHLYDEEWAQEYIGFIPKRIISERLKDGTVLSGEEAFSINLNPGDFYDVLTKNKLFEKETVNDQTESLVRGIGDNNPPSAIDDIDEQTEKLLEKKDTKSLTTQNFLDDKLMDELLVMRGGIEGFKKRMSGPMAPMPASTKAKMEMELQNKLFDKYKINEYPEGETPETVTKERQDYLIHTYNKRLAAIEYITSVAYDVIGRKDKDSLLVVDEDGLPLAGAKIAIPGSGRINQSDVFSKDALVIVEAGSVFREAGDQLFNDIIQKAKDEGKKYVVAEDLTSEGALQAMKDRGFRTPTTKDTKKFKGKKIRRPNGRSAVQKNLVYVIK